MAVKQQNVYPIEVVFGGFKITQESRYDFIRLQNEHGESHCITLDPNDVKLLVEMASGRIGPMLARNGRDANGNKLVNRSKKKAKRAAPVVREAPWSVDWLEWEGGA